MNFAIILSGGTGSRLKGIDLPKQYYKVCGRTILSYCMESIGRSGDLDAYVVVAAEEWRGTILQEMQEVFSETSFVRKKFQGFAPPGENRQLSVLNGLYALQARAKETDIVLVQDAARPLTSAGLIGRCIEAAKGAGGSMPVLKMKDTVYYSADGTRIDSLLERDKILAGQAPEAFAFGLYLKANECLAEEEMLAVCGSSEPALKAGIPVALVDGEEENFKITTAEDLRRFEKIMEEA